MLGKDVERRVFHSPEAVLCDCALAAIFIIAFITLMNGAVGPWAALNEFSGNYAQYLFSGAV
jgi:hypothetical protein